MTKKIRFTCTPCGGEFRDINTCPDCGCYFCDGDWNNHSVNECKKFAAMFDDLAKAKAQSKEKEAAKRR